MHPPSPDIAVLGAGSWGTALALYLAKRGQDVRLWTRDAIAAKKMQQEGANTRYLPEYAFPSNLQVTHDLAAAISTPCEILIAVPSVGFRELLLQLKPLLKTPTKISWATKGLDLHEGELLHHVIKDILGGSHQYAVLSGPSFAKEVAAGLPTAIVAASEDEDFAKDLIQRFNSPLFRVYLSHDVTGVEVGGIVKNVLAIATGMCDGMQLGANARCALITRGLAEMTRLGLALGASSETFTGLSGVGDLILTCTDNQSRNRRFGLALGAGKTIDEAQAEIGQVIEGRRNAELLVNLAKKLNVEMPICEMVWAVIQKKMTLQEGLQSLLAREPKSESES